MLHKLFPLLLLLNLTICSQEWHPEFYSLLDEDITPQMMHAIKELPKLSLSGNESVLDIGCGDGGITRFIGQKLLPNGRIHGIDISSSMIGHAKQHNTSSNVSFNQASLFDYDTDQSYDAVTCFWVLYLFDNYAEALQKVIKTLKPNGKALICHIIAPGTPFLQGFKKAISPQKLPFNLPTLETVMEAVQNAPASIEYFELKYNYDRYKSLDELCMTMKKIPFFALLETKKETIFLKYLEKLYQPRPDGYIYDYAHVVCMVLKKI